jgi:hypothetical protein
MQPDNLPNTCILHVGMRNTGTTSIQRFLLKKLADPAYRQFCFDHPLGNASEGMIDLFSGFEKPYIYNTQKGLAYQSIVEKRPELSRRLEAALDAAGQSKARLVISAERLWNPNAGMHTGIRDFMNDRAWAAEVIAYLRPPKQWLESIFQQILKMGNIPLYMAVLRKDGFVLPRAALLRETIETLDKVYGKEKVRLYAYEPRQFEKGCIVGDFCRQLGVAGEVGTHFRSNESLRVPAIRFLYAYRRFAQPEAVGKMGNACIKAMYTLQGQPLRFHSSLIRPAYRLLEAQFPWLEERLGFSLREDIHRDDDGPCIRCEADLFDFDPESLEWLAEQTGGKPVRPTRDEAAARAVAEQVRRLRNDGPRRNRPGPWHFFRSLGKG